MPRIIAYEAEWTETETVDIIDDETDETEEAEESGGGE